MVSRTGAEVEPALSRPEQKRRRVTWGSRWAGIKIPVVLQQEQTRKSPLRQEKPALSHCRLLRQDRQKLSLPNSLSTIPKGYSSRVMSPLQSNH